MIYKKNNMISLSTCKSYPGGTKDLEMLRSIASNDEIIDVVNKIEGEVIAMYQFSKLLDELDLLEDDDELKVSKEEEAQIQSSIEIGIKIGTEIGIINGKSDTLLKLLQIKLGTISPGTKKAIETSSVEQLDAITKNFFTITSEDEIDAILKS